jgi:hypothetical protein
MGKEGLAAQDRSAGADTGMIIAKNILGGIKKDAIFFAGELFINTDPFHCFTSAGLVLSAAAGQRQIDNKECRTMLARAVPKIATRINLLISWKKIRKDT